MLKKLGLIGVICILCTATVGCTLNQPRLQNDTNCARLKRQYIYNSTNPNFEASWVTSSQKAALQKQMAENNCTD